MEISQVYSSLVQAELKGSDSIFKDEASHVYKVIRGMFEKRINGIMPKQTDYVGFDGRPIFICPNCRNEMINCTSHCGYCGQKFNWSSYDVKG